MHSGKETKIAQDLVQLPCWQCSKDTCDRKQMYNRQRMAKVKVHLTSYFIQ